MVGHFPPPVYIFETVLWFPHIPVRLHTLSCNSAAATLDSSSDSPSLVFFLFTQTTLRHLGVSMFLGYCEFDAIS
jgi:hypothetical protein